MGSVREGMRRHEFVFRAWIDVKYAYRNVYDRNDLEGQRKRRGRRREGDE